MTNSVAKKDFLETKLENIAGKDDLRPALQCVYFKNGYAYCTDAHIAIKQSLTDIHGLPQEVADALEGKLLHKDSIKQLRGCKYYEVTEDGVTAHTERTKTTHHFVDEKYPDIEAVFPKDADISEKYRVGLSPVLLERLNKVMLGSTDGVVLDFYSGYKAILVTNSEYTKDQQSGFLMPLTIEPVVKEY